jgi:hypothetical protein
MGETYVIAFGKHENRAIVPLDVVDKPMFAEVPKILKGNILQIISMKYPPIPAEPYVDKGPTVCCDIVQFKLGLPRDPTWFVLQLAVTGEFSLVHGKYTITLSDGVLSITW